jgi:hypothetical protein
MLCCGGAPWLLHTQDQAAGACSVVPNLHAGNFFEQIYPINYDS